MAATTTPHIKKLFRQIKADFKHYIFIDGEDFYWSNDTKTITFAPIKTEHDVWLLLHEIAHAELGHQTYTNDIELVRYEAEAWHHAVNALAPIYQMHIDQDFIEDNLDTYRRWLHKRSLCPNCMSTGTVANKNTYSCINCRCFWRVNDARLCKLKRKILRNSLATTAN